MIAFDNDPALTASAIFLRLTGYGRNGPFGQFQRVLRLERFIFERISAAPAMQGKRLRDHNEN
jgi:hypothetical protein